LILTTVHANTAVQALCRLLDLGVEASMLASTVRLLIGQRLVKRLCPHCRKPHRKAAALDKDYGRLIQAAADAGILNRGCPPASGFFEAGGGCPACRGSGFSGRTGIFEFREIGPRVSDMLLRQRSRFDPAAAETALASEVCRGDVGPRSMRDDGILKAKMGLTAPEEVFGATLEATRAI